MDNQQLLVLFLKGLVAAKKSLGLYPPGSEMATAWIQRLRRSLDSFLEQGMSFPIRVDRDRFRWAGEDLLTVDPTLETFRFDLEARGITEFSIQPAVEDWELQAFLELLNQPPTSLESVSGAAAQLRTRGVTHVAVVTLGPGGVLPDGEAGEATWRVMQTGRDALDLFVEAVLTALGERLADLTYDRAALQKWFRDVAEGGQIEDLYGAIKMLGSLAEGGGDREIRTRTMLEALLLLPADVLRPLLTKWLVPLAGTDLVAFNLLTQVTDDELSQIARLVPQEQLLALTSELLEFPWEEGKRQRLLEAIAWAVRRQEESAPAPGAAALLSRDDPVLVELRREITESCHPDVLLERSTDILLALIFNVESDEYPGFVVDALEELIGEALGRGKLDLAVRALSSLGASTQLGGQKMREHARRLELFRRRVAGRAQIALVAGILRDNVGPAQMERAAEYLRGVAREGVEEFANLLAEERDRRVRARMCQVLARVGPVMVPVLVPRLDDTRWYVVRNLLYVLGRIGHESAFLPLIPLLDHQHPRVRVEAIRALALVGGEAAAGPILRCVPDHDPTVCRAAVKALGSLRSDEGVPVLRDLLTRPVTADDDLDVRQEAVTALAAIGTPVARGVLDDLAGRRVWFWQRAEKRIRAMAADALSGRRPPGGAPAGAGRGADGER
jgi:HEAT repeat protein